MKFCFHVDPAIKQGNQGSDQKDAVHRRGVIVLNERQPRSVQWRQAERCLVAWCAMYIAPEQFGEICCFCREKIHLVGYLDCAKWMDLRPGKFIIESRDGAPMSIHRQWSNQFNSMYGHISPWKGFGAGIYIGSSASMLTHPINQRLQGWSPNDNFQLVWGVWGNSLENADVHHRGVIDKQWKYTPVQLRLAQWGFSCLVYRLYRSCVHCDEFVEIGCFCRRGQHLEGSLDYSRLDGHPTRTIN